MKNVFKKFLSVMVCVSIIFVVFIFHSIYSFRCYNPFSQKNSIWISSDKKIVLTIPDTGSAFGSLQVNGVCKDVTFVFYMGDTKLEVYPKVTVIDDIMEKNYYEKWHGVFFSKKKFIVKVDETTFYEEGQKITFMKQENHEAEGKSGDGSKPLKKSDF